MTSFVIRRATSVDVPEVAAIERATFADPWAESFFGQLVEDPRAWFACARGEVDAQFERPSRPPLLGYVVAVFAADEGEIANLAVAAGARGHGVGSSLLEAALERARAKGASAIYLEVRESNAQARRLYGAKGFVPVGRRRAYYRNPIEDALILSRRVDASLG